MRNNQNKRYLSIIGCVVHARTHVGIVDAFVEAWILAGGCAELVSTATTDASGSFTLDVQEEALLRLAGTRAANVYFRVYLRDELYLDTSGSITWRINGPAPTVCIPLDLEAARTSETKAPWVVRGRLIRPNKVPLAGMVVRAYDRNVGSADALLGQATTDSSGYYRLSYAQSSLGRPGKQRADLAVYADDATGVEMAMGFLCRAPAHAVIDLMTAEEIQGPSEYERLMASVVPVLGGVQIRELGADGLALAACSAGVERMLVELLVAAHRLAYETGKSSEIFYGLLRFGLSTERKALLASGLPMIRQALLWAIEEEIIARISTADIDRRLEELLVLVVGVASEENVAGMGSLDDLLATALPASADRQNLILAYVQHRGPIERFWQELEFSPSVLADVQLTLQLAALTRQHLPLVNYLKHQIATGEVSSLRALSRFGIADWRALLDEVIDGVPIGAPATVPGGTDDDKRQNYATVLAWTLQKAFPGAALAGRLSDASPILSDAVQLLAQAEGFELGRTRVRDYLAKHPTALAGAANPAITTAQLTAMERLHKLSASASEIKVLMTSSLDSAQSIVRMGRAQFTNLLGAQLGASRTNAIFNAAKKVNAASHALAAKYHRSFNSASAHVLPKNAPPEGEGAPDVADWPILFGSLDFCSCGHCRSVYSPAAYLVDLLQFLERQSSKQPAGNVKMKFNVFEQAYKPLPFSAKSARDVLLDRRPDIASLELTCKNTDTPIPYVDLVNEILEYAVANTWLSPDIAFPDHIATVGTAAELAALPQPPLPTKQIVHDTAYEVLAARPYPLRLPFHRWQEEARIYLDHLGVSRANLMEVLRRGAPIDPADYSLRIALDRLRLSAEDDSLLIGTTPANPWDAYGLNENVSIADPSGSSADPIQGTWLFVLRHVAVLMNRTAMTYEELLATLRTRFVNPSGSLQIEAAPGEDPLTCKLSALRIPALMEADLNRIHRFTRLRRALGWSAAELDQAIFVLGGSIDESLLKKLASITWILAELRVPLIEALAYWGPLQMRPGLSTEERSLYERLFLNKTVKSPVDPAFELNAQGTDLADSNQPLAAHAPAILAALRIGANDLALLTNASASQEALNLPPLVDNGLHLPNLSKLFRVVSLARSLKLSVRDLLTLRAISGIDVFATNEPDITRRFVEVALAVRATRFGIARLDYLLRHVAQPTSGVAPDPARIDKVLADLAAGLDKILANPDAPAEDGEPLEPMLARVVPEARLARVVALIDGTLDVEDAEKEQIIDQDLSAFLDLADAKSNLVGVNEIAGSHERRQYVRPNLALYLRLSSKLSQVLSPDRVVRILAILSQSSSLDMSAQKLAIEEDLGFFLDAAAAKAALVDPSTLSLKAARMTHVLMPLITHLGRFAAESFVRQQLSAELNLDAATMTRLLTVDVKASVDPSRPVIADFLDGLDGGATPSEQHRRTSFVRLEKISTLLRELKLSADELQWVLSPSLFDLNGLPTAPMASGQPLFEGWLRLAGLLNVRDALPAKNAALVEIHRIHTTGSNSQGQPVDLFTAIAANTGFSLEDIQALAGPGGWLTASFAQSELDQQLVRLSECCALLKRLGMPAARVFLWTGPNTTPADARAIAADIRDAVKAKYDEAAWSAIARPLQDALRERQRAALVDCVLWSRGYAGPDELFADLLVDVEMSPCQLTSRIKQAISSVQLFVQRCFLNLEPFVELDDDAAREWKWLKSYRVWEANRKVFLYPENWIEPELRDDKTPFFKALENELLQSDLDLGSAEGAFLRYLEKLDQVARLEVMGVLPQREGSAGGAVDVLHVFARTRGTPHTHYYRRHIDGSSWTPWEKIELDIQSEHLIPILYERRLLLFWADIQDKPEDDQKQNMGDLSNGGGSPSVEIEIRLAFSEYVDGKWTARRAVDAPSLRVFNNQKSGFLAKQVYFRAFTRAGSAHQPTELVIHCVRATDYDGGGPTTAQSVLLGEIVLSGCRGLWEVKDYTSEYNVFWRRRPGRGVQDRMAIAESPSQKNDGRLYLLAGDLLLGDQKQLAEDGEQITTLAKTPGRFRLVFAPAYEDFVCQDPFFYEDKTRSYFITPLTEVVTEWYEAEKAFPGIPANLWIGEGLGNASQRVSYGDLKKWAETPPQTILIPHVYTLHRFRFEPFHHPYVCDFIQQLRRYGLLTGLLDWSRGEKPIQLAMQGQAVFDALYAPTDAVVLPYPVEEVDFSFGGAYAQYNWELFFHAPLLIAERLSENQRFEEAQRWFHTIFDPTTGSKEPVPARFWKVRPFYEQDSEALEAIEELLAGQSGELSQQIEAWRRDPFNPHRIARLRPVAYQKAVVMKYIDNLIRWGDQLFRRDTIESINEATQLYVLAADILGPRPRAIPPRATVAPKTYRELEPLLDDFSNALVEIEGWVAPAGGNADDGKEGLTLPTMLYFCVPPNEKLLGCWDTIADRLYKIRHCMNIDGVARTLPLFEPPIDPALLVQAKAAGVDLGTVINDLGVSAPHHRFQVLLQKANELCNEVKALGSALLAAREKRDGEALAAIRVGHEKQLLEALRQVKERHVAEARESLSALRKAREMTSLRHEFYRDIAFMNAGEIAHITMNGTAAIAQAVIEGVMGGAAAAYPVPTVNVGIAGLAASPLTISTTLDGDKIGNSISAGAKAASIAVTLLREAASMSATLGSYERRWDEWKLQEKLTARELEQVDKQIVAAELRVAITEKELAAHDMQIEQAREVQDYLRDKFTNQDLYDWMTAQIAAVYFQAFQLAFDLAKRAEQAFRFERGLSTSSYIQFGHWDSLHEGLLAGERLGFDLKRLEMAWLELDRRELELTKHISLLLHDPVALMSLKTEGKCFVTLPEQLFDMDYPGHHMRRIKSVSLTLPCVAGPYTSVNCTLTLLSSKVRITSSASGSYADQEEGDVVQGFAPVQSVATSHAQNDSGLFELNFRDERYLPFEGAGAVSVWRLELPLDTNAFDRDSLSDAVFHLRYTARDGGELLRKAAREARDAWLANTASVPLARLFSLRQEFREAFQAFLDPAGARKLAFDLGPERFPFQLRGMTLQIHSFEVYLKLKPGVQLAFDLSLKPNTGTSIPLELAPGSTGLVRVEKPCPNAGLGSWELVATGAAALDEAVEDIALIVHYSAQGGV